MTEAFPGAFLKAADLQGKRVPVIIDKVDMEDIGGEEKPVVHFKGKDRGLVLNRTNANMIAEITGSDETDDWVGVSIILYCAKVDFQGRRVDAIRVDAPKMGTRQPMRQVPVTDEGNDDTVPF